MVFEHEKKVTDQKNGVQLKNCESNRGHGGRTTKWGSKTKCTNHNETMASSKPLPPSAKSLVTHFDDGEQETRAPVRVPCHTKAHPCARP